MRDLLAVTKALSDENRVRALGLLRDRELCLCQIVEVLALASSTVSKHMSVLHQARHVESRKEGRWAYFRLAEEDIPLQGSPGGRARSASLSTYRNTSPGSRRHPACREAASLPSTATLLSRYVLPSDPL